MFKFLTLLSICISCLALILNLIDVGLYITSRELEFHSSIEETIAGVIVSGIITITLFYLFRVAF